jgi:hypothetical protein
MKINSNFYKSGYKNSIIVMCFTDMGKGLKCENIIRRQSLKILLKLVKLFYWEDV